MSLRLDRITHTYHYTIEERTPEAVPSHTLRHTFGKNLVDAGVPLDRVAQLLGHESVDTTRIYIAPSEQDLQREVEKVALVYARETVGWQSMRSESSLRCQFHETTAPAGVFLPGLTSSVND